MTSLLLASLWITPCHKNRMTTRVITLWRVCITSLTTFVSIICFPIELMLIFMILKSRFKRLYNKQNLTLVVIFMKFMKLAEVSYKMDTNRSDVIGWSRGLAKVVFYGNNLIYETS